MSGDDKVMPRPNSLDHGSRHESIREGGHTQFEEVIHTKSAGPVQADQHTAPALELSIMALPSSEDPELPPEVDFSVFTLAQKRAIIIFGSFIGWLSPLSGSIYYPALNTIASDLHVTSAKVNLTVTTYLIMQGIAPMLIAGFSEKSGRRPAYAICFAVYIIANLALAIQNNYAALLTLRIVQSAGSSGTIAIGQGLIADCVVSAERGEYIAYASVALVLGPTVSPFLGGLLSQYLGWHWIFWFLFILAVAIFIPLALFLPETCREVVGDASIPPPWVCANVSDYLRFRNMKRKGIPIDEEKRERLHKSYRFVVPNPLGTFAVLTDFESNALILALSLAMACYYAIFTDLAKIFQTFYAFNDLQISLVALSMGGGSILATLTTGKLVDWNYRRYARKINFPIKKNRQFDMTNFPVELVRMQIGLPAMIIGSVAVIIYGWILGHTSSPAGPIVCIFIMGYGLVTSAQVFNVLMVDIYPGQAANAAAARIFYQCLLGAAASAAIDPMSRAMGNGWAYTVFAVLFLLSSIGPVLTMIYGMKWRKAKQAKAKDRQQSVGETVRA